jgi:hypothetical protein
MKMFKEIVQLLKSIDESLKKIATAYYGCADSYDNSDGYVNTSNGKQRR